MKKTIAITCLVALLALSAVMATPVNKETMKEVATQYAIGHNLQVPKYEAGLNALYFKATNPTFCTWKRERDNKEFQGIWGKLSNGNKICFSPSKKKLLEVVA